MATDISKIRNVGFAGHGGVGKTSLVEGILFAAGAINRLGKVDDGTTTTDFDPDEIKRKISLNTAAAFCDYKGHRLNLIDTPGYGDFVADARGACAVAGRPSSWWTRSPGWGADGEGWKYANEYAPPRAISQPPRPRAGRFFRTLESLQKLEGPALPFRSIGSEAGFKSVVDLVTMKALRRRQQDEGSEIPAEATDQANLGEKLVEPWPRRTMICWPSISKESAARREEMVKALGRAIGQSGPRARHGGRGDRARHPAAHGPDRPRVPVARPMSPLSGTDPAPAGRHAGMIPRRRCP
jgi:hypothetical protein